MSGRYTRPSEIIRTGGGIFSITRTCTVLVWLRSSKPCESAAGCAGGRRSRGKIKIFQRVAGRVFRRDVQGLEIVPLVFHLRPVGHGEPQPAHDVL